MRDYQKRFQRYWMDTDEKPKGKDRRHIEKQNRQEIKRELYRAARKI